MKKTLRHITYFTNPRDDVLAFLPDDAQIVLDVGCAAGAFGAQLKMRGMTVWGIEVNAAQAGIAETVLDRVLVGSVEVCLENVPEGFVDCIFCNDVLEHLLDPWAVVQRLVTRLRSGGTFVCSIPNIRHVSVLKALLQEGTWDYQDAGIRDKTHLRFFTASSMRALLTGAGLEVVEQKGINPQAMPFKFRMLAKVVSKESGQMQFIQFVTVGRRP